MITEKQMKIVNAVAELGVDRTGLLYLTYVARATEFNSMHDKGSFHFVTLLAKNKYWEFICTIEEYNQCIEEMKYHYDIPKWCSYNRADKELLTVENSDYSFYEKEKFVYGQDVYVNNSVCNNKEFTFGCFTLDGKKALLLDGYWGVAVESISSTPFKSKEDIELEAKEDQVIDMIGLYYDAYYVGDIKNFFNLMQENGDLSPIELEKE